MTELETKAEHDDSVEYQVIDADDHLDYFKEKSSRLRTELSMRSSVEKLKNEIGYAKLEKLNTLNEKLLSEIQKMQEQHDSALLSSHALKEMLEQVVEEKIKLSKKVLISLMNMLNYIMIIWI